MALYTRIHSGVTSTPHNCLQGLHRWHRNNQASCFRSGFPGDIAREIDEAVRRSGKDKSAWLLSAVLEKLGKPDGYCSPESRLETLIGKIEGLLHGVGDSASKALSRPLPINETALTAKKVIAQMVEESRLLGIQSSNKMIIARLKELGLRPARGGTWTTSAVDNMKRRMRNTDKS